MTTPKQIEEQRLRNQMVYDSAHRILATWPAWKRAYTGTEYKQEDNEEETTTETDKEKTP